MHVSLDPLDASASFGILVIVGGFWRRGNVPDPRRGTGANARLCASFAITTDRWLPKEATKDAINFGYPQPVVSALQAIATRSTAGLFRDPVAVAADQSVQQLAQTQANMLDKLGKRINGNLRAKRSLQEAATAWLGKIGQHLAALTSRLGTVAARLDQDQMEAMTALQQASVHLEASAQEQVDKALGGMGPTWNSVQEAEVLRLAACLRAFSAVGSGEGSSAGPFQGDASSLGAASSLAPGPAMPSFQPREIDGHAFSTPARSSTSGAAMEITNPDLSAKRRWNQRGSRHPRPSKSPRRELDLSAEPWARVATGLTPDRPQRTRAFPDEEELIPAVVTPPYTWDSAWYHISRQCWVQGAEYVGCVATSDPQEQLLPLLHLTEDPAQVVTEGEQLWDALQQSLQRLESEADTGSLVEQLTLWLGAVRERPLALPRVRQGLLTLAHAVSGHIYSIDGFGPSTAQEWLFPAELLAQASPLVGLLSTTWDSMALRVLATLPCPMRRVPDVLVLAFRILGAGRSLPHSAFLRYLGVSPPGVLGYGNPIDPATFQAAVVMADPSAAQFAYGPEPSHVQPLFGASLEPPFTLDTLMQVSAVHAGPPLEVFSGFSANHAVLLTPNGLVYVEVPVFADSNTYRRLVTLQASPTAAGGIMRLWQPLPSLPHVQFLEVHCMGEQVPCVLDFRPTGWRIVTTCVAPPVTPTNALEAAVDDGLDIPSEWPLTCRAGGFGILHKETAVSAIQPLAGGAPYVLLFFPHIFTHEDDSSSQAVGGRATWDKASRVDHTMPPPLPGQVGSVRGDAASSAAAIAQAEEQFPGTTSVYDVVADSSFGMGMPDAHPDPDSSSARRAAYWSVFLCMLPCSAFSIQFRFLLCLLPIAPAMTTQSEPPSPRYVIEAPKPALDAARLAPPSAHQRLQTHWQHSAFDVEGSLWPVPSSGSQQLRFSFKLWGPDESHVLEFLGVQSARDVRTEILRYAGVSGRPRVFAASFGLTTTQVHLVMASTVPTLVTILFDAGFEVWCVDVPRHTAASHLLSVACDLAATDALQLNSEVLAKAAASASAWLDPVQHQDHVVFRVSEASDPSDTGFLFLFSGTFDTYADFARSLGSSFWYVQLHADILRAQLHFTQALHISPWELPQTFVHGDGLLIPYPEPLHRARDKCLSVSHVLTDAAADPAPEPLPFRDYMDLTRSIVQIPIGALPMESSNDAWDPTPWVVPGPFFQYEAAAPPSEVQELAIAPGDTLDSSCRRSTVPLLGFLLVLLDGGSGLRVWVGAFWIASSANWASGSYFTPNASESEGEAAPPDDPPEGHRPGDGLHSRPAGPPPPTPAGASDQPDPADARLIYNATVPPDLNFLPGSMRSAHVTRRFPAPMIIRWVQNRLIRHQHGLLPASAFLNGPIPQGTPFRFHNPFTSRAQCHEVGYQEPEHIPPLGVLQAHADNRGWRGVVLLNPQPDSAAVHLIALPQHGHLASIGLIVNNRLVPCCVPRRARWRDLSGIAFEGVRGRLDLPPHIDVVQDVVTFRSGDCFRIDTASDHTVTSEFARLEDVDQETAEAWRFYDVPPPDYRLRNGDVIYLRDRTRNRDPLEVEVSDLIVTLSLICSNLDNANIVVATAGGRRVGTVPRHVARDSLAACTGLSRGSITLGGVPSNTLDAGVEIRNGDVVFGDALPSSSGRHTPAPRVSLSWILPALGCRRASILGLVLGALLLPGGAAMQQPLAFSFNAYRVGRFPWREDTVDADIAPLSTHENVDTVYLSPFSGPGPVVTLPSTFSVSAWSAALVLQDPAWGAEACPVWPTVSAGAMVAVPRVLDVISIRIPPALGQSSGDSQDEIVWRTGDLVVALPPDAFTGLFQTPVFTRAEQLRHCAIWSLDFCLAAKSDAVIWQPDTRPICSPLYLGAPAGAHWMLPSKARFQNAILASGPRFPGLLKTGPT
ncbi:unnamed protein product [Symbiodinium sp. KB8]|nr:unnamed protein product [Symbiodinium sp. KB8]